LREILYNNDVWEKFPHYKIVLGRVIAGEFHERGFWWQSKRILNHVHLWKKKQKIDYSVKVRVYKNEIFDTLRPEGGGDSS